MILTCTIIFDCLFIFIFSFWGFSDRLVPSKIPKSECQSEFVKILLNAFSHLIELTVSLLLNLTVTNTTGIERESKRKVIVLTETDPFSTTKVTLQ